ncbi:MAG: hypothetical protein ACK6AD_13370 [Cyanobacteriota bacterium]
MPPASPTPSPQGLQRQGLPAVCVVPPDAPAMFRQEGVSGASENWSGASHH